MNSYIWFQLIIVCMIGAISPGPSLALIINNTVKRNRLNGILTSVGHGLGVSLYALITVLGLGFIINNHLNIFIGLQILGSIFLIFIGVMNIITANNDVNVKKNEKNIFSNSFFQGFAIAFLNPKILVWFTALFSQFINVNANLFDKIILVLTPGIIDTIWYSFVAITITLSPINSFINNKKPIIQKTMGLMLVFIAFALLTKLF